MEDATSAAESSTSRATRELQRYSTIVVVGGGCYGSYYVRQLGRAFHAGAITWNELVVVDRDASCTVAALAEDERPPRMRVVVAEWEPFFTEWLAREASHPEMSGNAAIVPSPLMPHLMADWLVARARERWPQRTAVTTPLEHAPQVPWQRAGDDGTHYVSFAEWMCPINCIEPARCPHTRGPRTWSMPPAIQEYANREREEGRPLLGPFVFHCTHRSHGVGMIDVGDVLAADRAIAEGAASGETALLVGTASHCHGALRRIVLGA